MKHQVVEQLAPTLLAYTLSKIYGTPTPPMLITQLTTGKVGTQKIRHVERRTVRL